jgi:hypothetical protein
VLKPFTYNIALLCNNNLIVITALDMLNSDSRTPPASFSYPEAGTVGTVLIKGKKAYLLKCSLEDVIGDDISVKIKITHSEYLSLVSSFSSSKTAAITYNQI